MEDKLKNLLMDLMKQEETKVKEIDEINEKIEQERKVLDFKEQNEIDRFVQGMKEDIEAGIYKKKSESEMQKIMDENQNSIKERYNREREQLNQRIEKAKKQNEEEKAKNHKKVSSEIKKYHTDMVLQETKAKRELSKMEEERNKALKEINKNIAEKEAKRTHLIMRNRRNMDIEGSQALADIRALEIELEQLKEEKENLGNEYSAKIEAQLQFVQYSTEQKEKVAKLLGQVYMSSKSIEEIYQALYGEVQEVEEEQPVEEVEEEQLVEEVEEEQPVEEVEEEQPVEEVEEGQPAEEVEQEQPVVVEEKQLVEEPKVIEKPQPKVERRAVSEDERNYTYFINNKENIVKLFMQATCIKQKEATAIFSDKANCTAIAKLCREAMPKPDRNKLVKAMESYYHGIDSKLDIEVSNEGIRYNDEAISALDITSFEESKKEMELVDKIVEKYDQLISSVVGDSRTVVYDKTIITAIAMDNCVVTGNDTLRLTPSGSKKLNQYLRLVTNANGKEGSVTYNLEKMSFLKSFMYLSEWPIKKVSEFRKIAQKTKYTYAKAIPGSITKRQWELQEKIKGLRTKKLEAGGRYLNEDKNVTVMDKINPWKVKAEEWISSKIETSLPRKSKSKDDNEHTL